MNVEGEKSAFYRTVQDDRKYMDDTSKLNYKKKIIFFVSLNWIICHNFSGFVGRSMKYL